MKRKMISMLLCISMVFSLSGQLVLPAKAYGESDWVEASQVPDTAEITARKWTYTKTTYVDSKETSLSGYEQVGSDWVVSGSGSKNYAAFPAGFDTSHSIYKSFHRSSSPPYTAYENATTKRTVTTSWGGYVYWHWMYDTSYANGNSVRAIYHKSGTGPDNGYYYKYFGAFTSTNWNYESSTGYCNSQNIRNYIIPERTSWDLCQGALRWFRFEYNTCYYTDYEKLYHYKKVEQLETTQEITETNTSTQVISNVKEMVKYKNTFTITYDANGGLGAPAAQTKTFDEPLTITSQVPVREGYAFLGWDVAAAALAPSYVAGDSFVSNGDATLYAIWRSTTPCTVTYDYAANGGTGCSQETATGYLGESADLTVTAERDGWTFLGWGTSPEDTTPLDSYTLTGDVTLYALYSRTVSAGFYYPSEWFIGGNYVSMGILYNKDTEVLTTMGETRQIPGWTQVGWLQKSTGQAWPLDGTVSISDSEIFYARYSKPVTLSYDANGGSSTPESQTVELFYAADGTYEQAEPVLAPAIEMEGYTFNKWVVDGEEPVEYAPGDTIFLTEDTTVTASWTELPGLESPGIIISDTMTGKVAQITGPEGADIYYTLDGSSPTEESALYTGEIPLSAPGMVTLKAMACQEGFNDSPVVLETVVLEQLAAPEADVADGRVKPDTLISLENMAGVGEIRYTTDGSIPDEASLLYEEPLVMAESFTLTAVAYCPGYVPSEPVVYCYTLAPVYSVGTYGYVFSNVAESFGYTSTAPSLMKYCIPYSSVKYIFGDSVKGKSVYTSMTGNPWTGNCCGMASTSAMMFSQEIPVTSGYFGKESVHALAITDSAAELGDLPVLKFIEAMQISQYTAQFSQQYSGNRRYNADLANGYDLDQFYSAVKEDLAQDKNDIIAVGKSGVGAHALLAYRMEDVSDTESHLYIYDCNFPDDEERYITLTKNAQGHFVDWSYDMGGYGIWGTAELRDGCYISYIPFDTIRFIWEYRGRLFDNNVSLTVNKDNVAIYNYNQEMVAEIVDGRLVTDCEDIYEVPNLTLGESESGEQTLYLPEDYYYVRDLAPETGEFQASLVGETLGATVTTSAALVSLGINETEGVNQVSVDQASEEDYCTISLDSSYLDSNNVTAFENITLNAVGTGQTVSVVSTAGTPVEEEDPEEDLPGQSPEEGDEPEGDDPAFEIVVRPGIFDMVLGSPNVGAGAGSVTMTSPAGSKVSISNCTLGSCKINGEEKIKYEVGVAFNEGGSVTVGDMNIPNGEIVYAESGSDTTYVFQPQLGYRVADVLVDEQSMGPLTEYTVEKINGSHTIQVVFERGYGLETPVVAKDTRTITTKVLSADKASLLAGLYDGDGRMIEIKWIPVAAGTDKDLSAQFIRAIPQGGSVKVFLISADGKPLCESQDLRF